MFYTKILEIVIDTYDLISASYYREIDLEKLVPIEEEEEWNIVEDIVKIAYQKHRVIC